MLARTSQVLGDSRHSCMQAPKREKKLQSSCARLSLFSDGGVASADAVKHCTVMPT